VLVGASIAGIFIQAYQRVFPTDVAALVFTNSSNRIGFQMKDTGGLIWELTETDIRFGFPLPPSASKGPEPTREADPFDKLPQTCRRFVCGWMCTAGRSPIHPRQSPRRSCLGEKNF
jgi:hypothetical protein